MNLDEQIKHFENTIKSLENKLKEQPDDFVLNLMLKQDKGWLECLKKEKEVLNDFE